MNRTDGEAPRLSMDRAEMIDREERAQLWLDHDIVQTEAIRHAPAYFD